MLKDFKLYEKLIRTVVENSELSQIKNKTIMITGANGLIGSAIIDILMYLNKLKYNIKIIAVVRSEILSRFQDNNSIIILKQDVTEEINYNKNVDYIIHAASNSNPILYSTDPVGTMLGNFYGMNNVLKFAVNNNVKRVEYISTGEVYGQSEDGIESFDEKYFGKFDSSNFRNCYPLSKLASENLCISYSHQYNLETVIARPSHCYGPTQTSKDERASAQFINNVLKNQDIIMKSDGKQIRSYCFVLDCAIAILIILLKGEDKQIYNITDSKSIVSIKELAEIIAQVANKKVVFQIPNQIEKAGYTSIKRGILDACKLEKLGWKAQYDIKNGIVNTINILK